MYKLTAKNESGASVEFKGETKKSVLNQFDNDYSRKGFMIFVEKFDDNGHIDTKSIIKSTYR